MVQACNNFVFVVRDESEKEKDGMFIPNKGVEKPHEGTIHSVGSLVRDSKIKNGKNKKCVFHKGIGFSIDVDGTNYLVLADTEIIGVK
jgi:co-chaperonin GroES (HSP10)